MQREIENIEQEIQKIQKLVEGDFTKSKFQDLKQYKASIIPDYDIERCHVRRMIIEKLV